MAKSDRMSKEEFLGKLAPLGEDGLRKALWNLYWRAGAPLRERIEAELEPEKARQARADAAEVSAELLAPEAEEFVELARSGAYMGGTRLVSRNERSKWRVTFRRLLDGAMVLVQRGDLEAGAPILERLLDLANDTRSLVFFHSDDPVDAMKLVFSDRVEVLWRATLERQGFAAFAARSAAQIVRWESRYGWTVRGFSKLCEKERPLASVLFGILHGVDSWAVFADAYLKALDATLPSPEAPPSRGRARASHWQEQEALRRVRSEIEERTARLAAMNMLLVDRLLGSELESRLDRLLAHPALGGPELDYLKSRVAWRRSRQDQARTLVEKALARLPGHPRFLEFAREIGAKLPPERKPGDGVVFVVRSRR